MTVRAERGMVVCDVRDEGPGLSVEDQAKLFQRGVRLSSVPTAGSKLGKKSWLNTSAAAVP